MQFTTLFDELAIRAIMAATGTDEPAARFILALHQGVVSGDIDVEGQRFVGTRLVDDSPETGSAPRVIFDTNPSWKIALRVSGVSRRRSSTVDVSFAPREAKELVWHAAVAPPGRT